MRASDHYGIAARGQWPSLVAWCLTIEVSKAMGSEYIEQRNGGFYVAGTRIMAPSHST
jgi:hypothetical protein